MAAKDGTASGRPMSKKSVREKVHKFFHIRTSSYGKVPVKRRMVSAGTLREYRPELRWLRNIDTKSAFKHLRESVDTNIANGVFANFPFDPAAELAELLCMIFRRKSESHIVVYEEFLEEWERLDGICGSLPEFLDRYGFKKETITGIERLVSIYAEPIDGITIERYKLSQGLSR
jgi:hypothetical protein